MGIRDLAAAQGLVRALKGNLMNLKGTIELIETGTLKEALEYLRKFPYYNKLLSPVLDESSGNIRLIEHLLKQSIIDDASRLRRFLPKDIGRVIEKMIVRYELDNIKTVMNGLRSGQEPSVIEGFLFDMRDFRSIENFKLLNTHSIRDLVDVLRDTRYGRPLQNAYERYRREESLFPLEIALDLFYFEELWDSLWLVNPSRRRHILSVVGTEMDLRQIQWILRFKINFRLPPEEVYNYTIPRGYLLGKKLLDELVESDDLKQFVELLPSTYARLVEGSLSGGKVDFTRLEIASWHYIYTRAVEVFYRRPVNAGMIFAYLVMKRVETDDIISILESKRYEVGKGDIMMRYIIRAMDREE